MMLLAIEKKGRYVMSAGCLHLKNKLPDVLFNPTQLSPIAQRQWHNISLLYHGSNIDVSVTEYSTSSPPEDYHLRQLPCRSSDYPVNLSSLANLNLRK
jgi:hypothetical protein